MVQRLKESNKINIILDCWSKKGYSSSYLGATAVYFSNITKKLEYLHIALSKFQQTNHTAQLIKDMFLNILSKYNIDSTKVGYVITDGGSNVVAAFKQTKM